MEGHHFIHGSVRLMLLVPPAANPIIHRAFHPTKRDAAAVPLDVIGAGDSIEREFEIARVMRIVRVNRHAETEE
jgi:hypothetical protein